MLLVDMLYEPGWSYCGLHCTLVHFVVSRASRRLLPAIRALKVNYGQGTQEEEEDEDYYQESSRALVATMAN